MQAACGQEPTQSQFWSLSLVGDWASTTRDGVLENRSHTAVHEIASLTKASSATVALNHDAKGNLTLTQNGQTLSWNLENPTLRDLHWVCL
mgnify:CR=1 FL=1